MKAREYGYNVGLMRTAAILFLTSFAAFAQTAAPAPKPATAPKAAPKPAPAPLPQRDPGLYATFRTSMGDVVCVLYEKEAPLTVANFRGLATGAKPWTDPKTMQTTKRPLYSGTIFHRVIPNFMIQGGDPMGNGMGSPGYKFNDETNDKVFDKKGVLAMANSGPNTNGSQFFITVAPTPWLNGHHTIFGQVIEGQDIVDKISEVPRDQANGDRPLTEVKLTRIVIQRYPIPAPVKKTTPVHRTTPATPTKKP